MKRDVSAPEAWLQQLEAHGLARRNADGTWSPTEEGIAWSRRLRAIGIRALIEGVRN